MTTQERTSADGTVEAGEPAPEGEVTAADTDAGAPAARRRLRPLSLTGGVLAVVFAAMSVTPSLVPRPWLFQTLLTGLCLITGYAIGAFLGWAYRVLQLPVLPPSAERIAWRVLGAVAVVGLLVAGWLGRSWQSDQRETLTMDTSVPWLWVLAPLLGFLVALLLLGIGRGLLAVGRGLNRLLRRVLPPRVALLIAVVVTGLLAYVVVSGLLIDNAITAADKAFEGANNDDKPGVVNPESPYRSGGPDSLVSWDSIGREGRQFIWEGPTATDIADVVGDPDAVEPVRAFIGLRAAPTSAQRANLAVEEVRALGGFDRSAIAIAGGTGSGWIDPKASAALEYAAHGDVATVSMQYSYLPSWMSIVVDQNRAQTNAEELITAFRVALDEIPPEERPELYVYGESLGAFSTDSAFTSVEDMSTTTNGALLIGPPSFDETWQKLVTRRDPGSPNWKPRYDDGALVRVAAIDADLTDPTLTWRTDNRIIYLVHPSDPIVAWTADYGQWLDPRGPDISTHARAWPVVGILQLTVDQLSSKSPPAGHGHNYDETVVTAWSEILGPPTLPDSEITAIRQAISGSES